MIQATRRQGVAIPLIFYLPELRITPLFIASDYANYGFKLDMTCLPLMLKHENN